MGVIEVCGECKHNKYDLWDDAFFCTNERSENCGCPTFYNDTCDEYEEKE